MRANPLTQRAKDGSVVLMAIVVVLSTMVGVISLPAATVAAASTTDVVVSPANETTSVGETTTFDIVVQNASGGVGAYEATVSLSNSQVGNITDISVRGDPDISTVDIAANNSSVYFDGALADTADTGAVTIATVTVTTTAAGQTGVDLSVTALGDEDGNSYTVDSISNGELTAGAVFEYSAQSLNTTAGTAPLSIRASATVSNIGGESGTVTVPFTVDGEQVGQTDITLAAGESENVSFVQSFNSSGSYTVAIGDLNGTGVSVNGAPVANVTASATSVTIGEQVTLDASGSTDPDGDSLQYEWDLNDSDGSEFDDATGATISAEFNTTGNTTVSVRVTDSNGASSTASITVTVRDKTPPNASAVLRSNDSDVTNGTVELGQTVTLDGTNSTDNVGIQSYLWAVSNQSADSTPIASFEGATASFTPQATGTYSINLTVRDTANNTGTATAGVDVIDTTPPDADLQAPDVVIVDANTTFNASGSTDAGQIVEYRWDFDGDGATDTTTSVPTVQHEYTAANNSYTVAVTVVDQSNNTDTATVNVTTSLAPAIEVGTPPSGSFVNTSDVLVSYRTSNLDAGDVDAVEYRIDGGAWNELSSLKNGSVNATGLDDGSHTVEFRLVNATGAPLEFISATASTQFTVDTTEPTLTLEAPSPGDVPYGTDIEFDATDENLENVTAEIVLSNGTTTPVQILSEPYVVSTDGIREGQSTVIVSATDAAGNTVTEEFDFDFVSSPTITDVTPNRTLVNTTTPIVTASYSDNATVGDTGINTSAVIVRADGESVGIDSANVSDTALSTRLTDLAIDNADNSTHTVGVEVTDNAGHTTTRTARFRIDTVAPRISLATNQSDRISTHNPVSVTVDRTDAHPESTVVEIVRAGTTVRSYNVTADVATGETTIVWNATDESGNPVSSGNYTVRVTSVDRAGNHNVTTTEVSVDTLEPNITSTEISTNSSSVTPPGGVVYVNDSVTTTVTANGTPGDVESVTVAYVANFTNFVQVSEATQQDDGSWVATATTDQLPDDGNYTVQIQATDPAGNTVTADTGTTVIVDERAPRLGASVSRVNQSTARVNLTASEPLDEDSLETVVTLPNGSSETVSMVDAGDGRKTGTFELRENVTNYNVTTTAADRAGNVGSDTATAVIKTVSTQNQTVTVQSASTGVFVQFNTSTQVNNTFISLTASDAPLAPLTSDLRGASFLNSELGERLTANLSNATIGIPVETADLPPGTDPSAVTIRRYNETQNKWVQVNTTVRTVEVNGTSNRYWTATVPHFSTYGAVLNDDTAPTLDSSDPSGNLAYGQTSTTVQFNYSDEITAVNASAVEVYFNGTEVTDDSATSITSSRAIYEARDLQSGETYEATVRVEDVAGNHENYSTTFTAVEDTTAPSLSAFTPAQGTQLSAGTSTVTLRASYTDDFSGVDPTAVKVFFDGDDVTSEASISGGEVRYTASGLADNSTHTYTVRLVDAAGNAETYSTTFSINASATTTGGSNSNTGAGGGGGGGGGGGSGGGSSALALDAISTSSGATIGVREITLGSSGSIDVPGVAGAGVTVDSIGFKFTFGAPRFRVEMTTPTTEPQNSPALPSATGSAIAYFRADAIGLEAGNMDQATMTITVDSLPSDVSPSDVVIYRYTGDEWVAEPTTHIDGTQFQVTVSDFSAFAVGYEASEEQTPSDSTTTAPPTTTSTATAQSTTSQDVTEGQTTSSSQTETSTPGFGVLLALMTLAGAALLAIRRQQ